MSVHVHLSYLGSVRWTWGAQDLTCTPIPSSPQPWAVVCRGVLYCQIEGGSWETILQRQQRQEGGTWCRLMSMRVDPGHSDEKKHSKSTVMGSRLLGLNYHPRHPVHGRQRNASKLR